MDIRTEGQHMDRNKQENTVSAGFALGMVLIGEEALPPLTNPLDIELSFWKTWREWPHAHQFPALGQYKPGATAAYHILKRYTQSRKTPYSPVYWEGRYVIPRETEFDMDDALFFANQIGQDINADDWCELAQGTFNRLKS